MNETMFVKPAPGRKVRDPLTGAPMPAEGAEVPRAQYWMRRLKAGDVAQATPPAPAAARRTRRETGSSEES